MLEDGDGNGNEVRLSAFQECRVKRHSHSIGYSYARRLTIDGRGEIPLVVQYFDS
jgi:hypothetical protein